MMTTMNTILGACLLLATTTTTTNAFTMMPAMMRSSTMLFETPAADEDNPCWQDLYDGDCTMESAYSANFVASEWIKSMPCGAGIEDCDMPEQLQVPTAMEDGVAEVDVMDFLGLKRANVGAKKEELNP